MVVTQPPNPPAPLEWECSPLAWLHPGLLLGCPFRLQAAGEVWGCFSALLLLDIFSFKAYLSCSLLAQSLTGLGNGALGSPEQDPYFLSSVEA